MKRISKVLSVVLVLVMALTCVPVGVQAKTTIKLNAKKMTIEKGSTGYLYVSGYYKTVKWSSSNKSVAKVDKSGTVTAIEEGKAVITAKCGKKKLKCNITVSYPENKKAYDVYQYATDLEEEIFDLYYYQEYAGEENTGKNPTLTLSVLKTKVAKMEAMNALCESLKASKYDLLKEIWAAFVPEFNKQYQNALATSWDVVPVPTHNVQYDLLADYTYKMFEIVYEK